MNSIIDINYDISITDKEFIKNTKGIFSFCIYTSNNDFDKNITDIYNLNSITYHKNPKLYIIGLFSYLSFIQKTEWNGWRVIIHTDNKTMLANPKTFEKFKSMGAIFGITTLKDKFSDLDKYRGIFRINRYYPLFIKELNIPIFIRDADTIFETYINNKIKMNFKQKKEKNITAKLSINSNDFILYEFIDKLSNWEQIYFNKVKSFKNKVIFSYDDEYSIFLNKNNNISKLKWTGKEEEKSNYKTKVRFLAGILSKIGESLPEFLWTNDLTAFLEDRFKNISSNNYGFVKIVNESDEYYLTNIIYEWCKQNNRVEFFKLNYVKSTKIKYFANKYFKNKYPELYKENINSVLSEWGPVEQKPNREKLNNEDKKIYNIRYPRGLTRSSFAFQQHNAAQKIQLENPKYQINNKFFFNPLTITNGSNRPDNVPLYYFGGYTYINKTKRKRKTYQKRKTYKTRK